MRSLFFILFFTTSSLLAAVDAKRAASTIVLDENGVKNLRIETLEVEETSFEETIFALGHIEVLPGNRSIVSSRIPGRAVSVIAKPHTEVDVDAEVAWVESRQPGDPPPVIKLTAPISGMVSKVNIAPGQPVSPEQELIEILDLTTVEAVANVPQHHAGKLKIGMKAHIRLTSLPDKVFEAKLAHIGATADEAAGTIEAAFHVPNPGKLLRPGMRAEFSLVISQRENVVSVPRAALQGDSANRFVYVKDFDLANAFVKTPVQVGQMNDRFVEITNGLLPADEVVTRGAYSLSFAGASSVSLKEALDAAHGHEHAEDGSELTPEKKAEMEAKKKGGGGDGLAHGHDDDEKTASPLWMYVSGVLFILLLISLFTRKQPVAEDEQEPAKKEET